MKAAAAALLPALLALALASLADAGPGAPAAAEVPAEVLPGDPFLVRVPAGASPPGEVEFLGKRYPALEAGGARLFLVGVDLDAAAGPAELVLRGPGGREERRPVRIAARSFPEERLTLPPAMVTPPPELEARIAREQALTAAIYAGADREQRWAGGFAPAVDRAPSGNFGKRRVLNGRPRSPHGGQDYAVPAGTPVRAIGDGRVRLAQELYYSGLTVLLDHGGGLVSQYLHLQELGVREGEEVARGRTVGLVGSTGRATGPHLHLGARLAEQRVDPERLFALLPAR